MLFFSRSKRTKPAKVPPAAATVITADGKLRQYVGAVTASDVLSGDSRSVLCNADDVEFDSYLAAVGPGEELGRGELYLVVPRTILKRPLHKEEVGELAVKATAAIAKAGVVLELGGGQKKVRERERRLKEDSFSQWLAVIPECTGRSEEEEEDDERKLMFR